MRYIESKDINGKPIFEGDLLSLTIKDKFFGGSYFGKFCSFYDIDEARINILDNTPYLQIKAIITFYKAGKQSVSNQENAYWEYYNGCLENSKTPVKKLEDFSDIVDAQELSELTVTDSLFLRYLISKGVEKVSGFYGEPLLTSEKSFLIKTKFNENIHLSDKVLIELDDEWKEKLSKDPESEECLINKFTHALFEFEKMPEQFDVKINMYLTDKEGHCKVFSKTLNEDNQEGLERYKLFVGLKGEIGLLNYFKTKNFKWRKI